MSQLLRYFSSSCFSGDKGLPSCPWGLGAERCSLSPAWAGVSEGLGSRQMSRVLLRDSFWGAHWNLRRGARLAPFREQPPPHLLESAAKTQQDGASRAPEPRRRGGRPRATVGVEDTQKTQPRLRAFLCAGPTSGDHRGRTPAPPGPLSAPGSMPGGLTVESFAATLLSGAWSSVMADLYHQAGGRKAPKEAPGPRPPPLFANEETEIQREGRPPTQGHTVNW